MIGGAAANKGVSDFHSIFFYLKSHTFFIYLQKAMAKDFDPNEIVNSGLFSLKDGGGSMKDAATGGLQNFGSDFLKALIPSPERLGGVIAVATVIDIFLCYYCDECFLIFLFCSLKCRRVLLGKKL